MDGGQTHETFPSGLTRARTEIDLDDILEETNLLLFIGLLDLTHLDPKERMEALRRSATENGYTIFEQYQPKIVQVWNGDHVGFYFYTTDDRRHQIMTRKERTKYDKPLLDMYLQEDHNSMREALQDLGKSVFTMPAKGKKQRCAPYIPILSVASPEWGLKPVPKNRG